MAYLAVDMDGNEGIFEFCPHRDEEHWITEYVSSIIDLPKGSIEKLIGRSMSWEDEPIKI